MKNDRVSTFRRLLGEPDPAQRDAVGFSSILLLMALPYKKPVTPVYVRKLGKDRGRLILDPYKEVDDEGNVMAMYFPYGAVPRLALIYIWTQVKRTGQKRVNLGNSLYSFLESIGYTQESRNYKRVRNQLVWLFGSQIRWTYAGNGLQAGRIAAIAHEYALWWSKDCTEGLFDSYVVITDELFNHIQFHAWPVDLDVLKGIHRNTLAIDLYLWLTYRGNGSRRSITWNELQAQFGNYSNAKALKRKAKIALADINRFCPTLRTTLIKGGFSWQTQIR